MPKPASDSVNALIGHLKYIERTRSKTERLFQKGDLVRRDLELIYAGQVRQVQKYLNFDCTLRFTFHTTTT